MPKQKLPQWVSFVEREPNATRGMCEYLEHIPIVFFLKNLRSANHPRNDKKNSKGETRTLDLSDCAETKVTPMGKFCREGVERYKRDV